MVSAKLLPDRSRLKAHSIPYHKETATTAVCECDQQHTMNHIVVTCPLTQSESLHEAEDNARNWLATIVTTALTI